MMPKPIWFPFYPNDFLASSKVALLTTEEVGAYVLLLCHAWQDSQCSLLDDDEVLSKLGRIKGDVTALRSCFTVKKHRLVNDRLCQEWIKCKEQKELASRHGKQGAMKRWIATPLATPLGLAIRNDSSSPSPSPSPSEKERREEEDHVEHVTVEQIREEWNRVEGVKPCKKITGPLSQRIKRLNTEHDKAWWGALFQEIQASKFLMGKTISREGKRPFRIDLDWATGPINLSKILSGKYADESSRPTRVVL